MDEWQRAAGLRRERVLGSKQYRRGMFRNPRAGAPPRRGSPWPLLGEYFFREARRLPPAPLPVESPLANWGRPAESGLRATWLGHSTVLLELGGRRVLTDPVFGERASPLSFAGPKRFVPVPVPLSALPPLDAVLLSHDHYDHLCRPTMQALARQAAPVVTSLGVGEHLQRFGIPPSRIVELDWHESVEFAGLRFAAKPARHFSGRTMHGRNQTLWSSWVVEGARHKVFFSGDTGLTPLFAETGRTDGPFDLVLLEIGAFHPSWSDIHLGPQNALAAFELLGGGTLLPVHWGTFSLALHAWDEPAETLVRLAGEQRARVITPRLGAAVEPTHVEGPTAWWREVALRSDLQAVALELDT